MPAITLSVKRSDKIDVSTTPGPGVDFPITVGQAVPETYQVSFGSSKIIGEPWAVVTDGLYQITSFGEILATSTPDPTVALLHVNTNVAAGGSVRVYVYALVQDA